jgi:hypothetical protein
MEAGTIDRDTRIEGKVSADLGPVVVDAANYLSSFEPQIPTLVLEFDPDDIGAPIALDHYSLVQRKPLEIVSQLGTVGRPTDDRSTAFSTPRTAAEAFPFRRRVSLFLLGCSLLDLFRLFAYLRERKSRTIDPLVRIRGKINAYFWPVG